MTRFDCNGSLKIMFNGGDLQNVLLKFRHDFLHERPENYGVTQEIKDKIREQLHLTPKDIYATLAKDYLDLTQKQVHYWWTKQIQELYKRNDDQLISAKIFLEETQFNIVTYHYENNVKYIGFLTNYFDTLKNNSEIICDATCK
jgi:hypothetical protein